MSPRDGADAAREREGLAPDVWSVGELTRRLGELVAGLGRVSVQGEVSRVSRAASGHVYFDLKDLDAKLACKLWRSQVARALKGELREGDRVVVHGRLDVYPPQGSYSLVVDRVESSGLGELLLRLEQLKAELRGRGWFDRRRPLPAFPRVIGIATSRDGAALQDFLRTRSQRWPLYPVRLAHTPVQGPGAAEQIARAVARLDASGVDVIVVCRGGGSLEDLWAFNELPVLEAIWNAKVPVVSGVGHETDTTLADLVADSRAHTPTDAAQATLPDRRALLQAIERAAGHLAQAVDGFLGRRAERLERMAAARVLRRPAWIHADRAQALGRASRSLRRAAEAQIGTTVARLGEASGRLERASPRRQLERRSALLERSALRVRALAERRLVASIERGSSLGRQLEALSPLAVLGRGYSITTRRDSSAPLVSWEGLEEGTEIETRLGAGRLVSRLSSAGPLPAPERPAAAEGGGAAEAG